MSDRISLLMQATDSCRRVLDLALRMARSGTATPSDRDYLRRELANGRAMLEALAPEFRQVEEQRTIGSIVGRNWHDAILCYGQCVFDLPLQAKSTDAPTIAELLPKLEGEHQQVSRALAIEAAAAERASDPNRTVPDSLAAAIDALLAFARAHHNKRLTR